MGTRHLYWILTGPSFAVWTQDLAPMKVEKNASKEKQCEALPVKNVKPFGFWYQPAMALPKNLRLARQAVSHIPGNIPSECSSFIFINSL
jgi:hypothetical protein